MKCQRCENVYADNYYKDKYSDEIICEDCLLELDGILTNTVTSYYLDGEYIGDDTDIDSLIENICYNCGFEEIKE